MPSKGKGNGGKGKSKGKASDKTKSQSPSPSPPSLDSSPPTHSTPVPTHLSTTSSSSSNRFPPAPPSSMIPESLYFYPKIDGRSQSLLNLLLKKIDHLHRTSLSNSNDSDATGNMKMEELEELDAAVEGLMAHQDSLLSDSRVSLDEQNEDPWRDDGSMPRYLKNHLNINYNDQPYTVKADENCMNGLYLKDNAIVPTVDGVEELIRIDVSNMLSPETELCRILTTRSGESFTPYEQSVMTLLSTNPSILTPVHATHKLGLLLLLILRHPESQNNVHRPYVLSLPRNSNSIDIPVTSWSFKDMYSLLSGGGKTQPSQLDIRAIRGKLVALKTYITVLSSPGISSLSTGMFVGDANNVDSHLPDFFSLRHFLWSHSCVLSRQNSVPFNPLNDPTPKFIVALTPLWDMMNHVGSGKASVDTSIFGLEETGKTFLQCVLNTECLSVGEPQRELKMFYGNRSNTNFLLYQGFVYEKCNVNDQAILRIPLHLGESLKGLLGIKKNLLAKEGEDSKAFKIRTIKLKGEGYERRAIGVCTESKSGLFKQNGDEVLFSDEKKENRGEEVLTVIDYDLNKSDSCLVRIIEILLLWCKSDKASIVEYMKDKKSWCKNIFGEERKDDYKSCGQFLEAFIGMNLKCNVERVEGLEGLVEEREQSERVKQAVRFFKAERLVWEYALGEATWE